jgi:hypothetical protein
MRVASRSVLFVLVLAIMLGSTALAVADQTTSNGDGERPFPDECALLDDLEVRALMDGVLLKMLIACGRADELGRVEQSPAEDVGPPTDDGPDVPVNDPSGDSGFSTTQSETSMALNEDTGTICAGYNDSYHYFGSGGGFTGFSRSTDGGATFTDQGALGDNSFGDPAIVWRRADGHFYFGALHSNGLGLWKSTDDCQSFSFVGMMHSGFSDDKELLAVDNNPTSPHYGNLYMTFTNFTSDGRIWALRSTDAGVTWTNAQAISSTSGVQGSWPVVAPNGDVFVGWVRFNSSLVTQEIVRSTDGGVSYSVVTSPAVNVGRPQNTVATGNCGRAALKGNIRYLPSPQLVVGPDGVLHVVYSYAPGGGDDCDSFYRRSADSGATWGPEIRLHDDATTSDQFFPTLSVGESNVLSATWYDRRLDPSNELIDYFQAFSFDGGLTWQPSQRISDVSTPVYLDPNLAGCYHGDYDTHIQTENHAVTQWSDDRNMMNGHNDPDVHSDRLPVSTDFLLSADPAVVSVCSPDDAVSTVTVLQFLGFDEPVTMAAAGHPAGTSAGFVPNPVVPPGTSDLTVSGTGGAAAGTYDVLVTGTSSPSSFVHDTGLTLHLFTANPGSIDPLTPADGALNQPHRPEFSWTAADQAAGYRVQVATDGFFGNVVLDESGIEDTVYTPVTDLPSNTQLFWRVRASNECGSGDWSSAFSFFTRALSGECGIGTVPSMRYFDDFESGAPGWTHSSASGPDTWALTGGITGAHSGSFVYHVTDVSSVSDQRLVSPAVNLPAGAHTGLTLQYWNYQDLEPNGSDCWDAGILEISTDDGVSWTQLDDTVLETHPYDGIVTSGSSNPLAGDPGWCGAPEPWKRSVVVLDDYAGETVRFRFRLGTDVAVGEPGWDIDDVLVQSCVPDEPPLFADGFESGDTSVWSRTIP